MADEISALDLEDDGPLVGPIEGGPKSASPDAPYGYKKDGTPAKKRGRPSGSSSSSSSRSDYAPRRGSVSLENQIGAFLFTVNAPLQLFLSNDALDAVEIQALASAINQECQRNARFRKYVESALRVQGGTSLMLVVAAIAGRRVVRHNLVDIPQPIGNEGADAMLGGIISMASGKGAINPNLFVMNSQDVKATS